MHIEGIRGALSSFRRNTPGTPDATPSFTPPIEGLTPQFPTEIVLQPSEPAVLINTHSDSLRNEIITPGVVTRESFSQSLNQSEKAMVNTLDFLISRKLPEATLSEIDIVASTYPSKPDVLALLLVSNTQVEGKINLPSALENLLVERKVISRDENSEVEQEDTTLTIPVKDGRQIEIKFLSPDAFRKIKREGAGSSSYITLDRCTLGVPFSKQFLV